MSSYRRTTAGSVSVKRPSERRQAFSAERHPPGFAESPQRLPRSGIVGQISSRRRSNLGGIEVLSAPAVRGAKKVLEVPAAVHGNAGLKKRTRPAMGRSRARAGRI